MNQSQTYSNPIQPILKSTVLGIDGKAQYYYAKQDAAGEWAINRPEAAAFWEEQAKRLKELHEAGKEKTLYSYTKPRVTPRRPSWVAGRCASELMVN